MKSFRVVPCPRIEGKISVPGDKSISHRAVIFGSIAHGPTRVTGFLPGEDSLCTLRILQALGARIDRIDETTLAIEGLRGKLRPAWEPLDCGNSGTGMRLLTGLLAGQPFRSRLFGDVSLSGRPMKRIIDPLTRMGAVIRSKGEKQTPPLEIDPASLTGIDYASPIASAQVKTCLLLAGLFARGTTRVTEPSASRDHTERLLQHFHSPALISGRSVSVTGGSHLHGQDLQIPGDFSSAAFWLVAAAASPGASLMVNNVGLNPSRTGLIKILLRMGAQIREFVQEQAAEPYGHLLVNGGRLRGIEIGGDEIPNVIDELPILAVAAALAEGRTVIRDAAELRVKESDRIAAMATNLRAFGVPVEERPDGMIIEGGQRIRHARVQSFGDHRIAMASAILALFADHPSRIDNVACIDTSYPGFFRDLHSLTLKYGQTWPERAWHAARRGLAKLVPDPLALPQPMTPPSMIVAIDGPAASGKSSVAFRLAQRLDLAYINTGFIYRAITWKLLQEKIPLEKWTLVSARMEKMKVECFVDDKAKALGMRIDGEDPLPFVKDPEINRAVSAVASVPAVRHLLLEKQRRLAEHGPLVVEGRDIGSVVFPETDYKFYIDADPAVRERRRSGQGEEDTILDRDRIDSSRRVAPLQCAPGAVRIDTSHMTLDEVVDELYRQLDERGFVKELEKPELTA